jgi:hypothetical protein
MQVWTSAGWESISRLLNVVGLNRRRLSSGMGERIRCRQSRRVCSVLRTASLCSTAKLVNERAYGNEYNDVLSHIL